MATIEDQISEIEAEIHKTQYNKATQHHIGKLKAKLANLRQEVEKRRSSGAPGKGFSVKKSGNATVGLVGWPSVGKSTLLNKMTGADSEVGAYEFTTLDIVPGTLEHKGASIQVLDMPGLIKGASKGKGRGKEVLSAARASDLLLILVDVFNTLITPLLEELNNVGIRINQTPPNVVITKREKGGIIVRHTKKLTHLTPAMVTDIVSSYGIVNAEVVLREDVDANRLVDALQRMSLIYLKAIVVITKIDLADEASLIKAQENTISQMIGNVVHDGSDPNRLLLKVSARSHDKVRRLVEQIFDTLGFIRIFLKPQGEEADMVEPLVMTDGSTVADVCDRLHREFRDQFRYALVWGPSAKFPGQTVSLKHTLKDEDVLSIIVRR